MLVGAGQPDAPRSPPGVVAVVGAVNVDHVFRVGDRPDVGETVVAVRHGICHGGKGANQAVAAAAAGARTSLFSAVGSDSAGSAEIGALAEAGVDVTGVQIVDGKSTGLAMVVVTPDGQNTIIVAPGANLALDSRSVVEGIRQLPSKAVVVLQSEVSPQVISEAAAEARRQGHRVVVNCAPFTSLPQEVLSASDPLVLNESEARSLLGDHTGEMPNDSLADRALQRSLAGSVVVTLGGEGALLATVGMRASMPAPRVHQPVDTTGAGDAFVGVLAAELARGSSLSGATEIAVLAGAAAVGWDGARMRNDARLAHLGPDAAGARAC